MWTLAEQNSALPLYKRIMALIERAIEDGLLSGGERLPSERRLCAMLSVNRSTVIRAVEELTDRGVLLRRQGSGTYVNHEKWGLQQYPILNWQPPPNAQPQGGVDEHMVRVTRHRDEAHSHGRFFQDLSGSDLAGELAWDLAPAMDVSETWPGTLRQMLRQELDAESSAAGLASFREAVREHLKTSLGLNVKPDEILITSGARQALFLISQCLLRPGDAVGIEAPSYFYSLPVFQAAGLRLYALPTDKEGVVPDGLDSLAVRRGIRMIFLNPIFQNPTGRVMSATRRRDIVHYCSARHIPIVEDDAYSLLGFSSGKVGTAGTDITPIKSHDAHGQVLYIGSLSSYTGANLRTGWLVAPAGMVKKLARVRQQMDAGLSVLPQFMAEHYLRTAQAAHRDMLRARLAERAAALQAWLHRELPGRFTWHPPAGGFYLYLHAKPEASGDPLEDLLQRGIVPARGSDFGDGKNRFRLNFSLIKPETLS